jgi:membrane-associated phospholipid phosphatase
MVRPGPLRKAAVIVAALLAVVCAVFAFRAPAALPLHLGMLVALLLVASFARRRPLLIILTLVAILMSLYSTIAEPAFVVMGRAFDADLAAADRALFLGHDPALLAAPFAHGGVLELFSFIYSIFVPYLWLSIFLGCFGRPAAERDAFILGLAIVYSLAYLGYLFVPSRGPTEWYHFAAPLQGGRFYRLTVASVTATGGNHGAFPSLHVGASAYLCLFDLRRNLLRGMTYLPLVVLIAIATVLLRYHYIVDLTTGLTLAVVAFACAMRALRAQGARANAIAREAHT